jgi:nucleotidyltransferase/DNA polymerase involved in DNA repair
MSGAEAITVLGLISSVITIIETSRDIYDAASSAGGLHEAFRAVSQNIPLVLNILRDCKKVQEQVDKDYSLTVDENLKRDIEESNKAVEPLIEACQENAKRLQEIFEKVVPENEASWFERYKKAAHAVMPGKKRKVEDLMKEILEKLQLLHTSRFFKGENEQKKEKKSKELETAISQLSELPSSLPEDEGRYSHHGSGAMFINPGLGTQHNYNQSGTSNSNQYNAHTLNIGQH